jgi:hypothetical protein
VGSLAFVSLPGQMVTANVGFGEPRSQCSSTVPFAFDAVRLIIRPMALLDIRFTFGETKDLKPPTDRGVISPLERHLARGPCEG